MSSYLDSDLSKIIHTWQKGSKVAYWKIHGLLSKRSGVRNLPQPCCVLEQDKFTPRNVIPRKWWLHTDMTEKLLIRTLSINTTTSKG